MCKSNHYIIIRNEVFHADVTAVTGNTGTAVIIVLILNRCQLFLDNSKNLAFISQYRLQPVYFLQNFLIFLLNLVTLKTGKSLETKIKNCLCLLITKLEALHECRLSDFTGTGASDSGNNCIKMIKSDVQAL